AAEGAFSLISRAMGAFLGHARTSHDSLCMLDGRGASAALHPAV
ncbi:MAG: hypothetical protein ACJAQ3_002486, partial [Planctomycetota bacterium]